MKRLGIFVGMLIVLGIFAAQAQQPTSPQRRDSIRIITDSTMTIPPDSVNAITEEDETASPQPDVIQLTTDSIVAATSSETDAIAVIRPAFKPDPTKAVLYSAIFPGLGQIYNRQYWKLPIVYSGFVVFSYFISWNNRFYQLYFGGYADIMDDDSTTIRWHNLLPYGLDPQTVDEEWFKGVLEDRKDYYRYYRDLSIIGTVAWYMLTMVDAYVDAHLFDFDISPDLSMRVAPVMLRENNFGTLGNSYGLQWSITF